MLPRNEVVEALDDAFNLESFDQMLSDHLSIDREKIVVTAPGVAKTFIISEIVMKADTNRWALNLIRAALKANPTNLKLKGFVTHYPEWDPDNQPPAVNPFLSVFMRGGRVFLKRDEFRQGLQDIGTKNNSRVLAIKGERDTGKTYSQEFLNFLHENYPGWAGIQHRIVYVDMDKCVFEAEDLARVIGERIGLEAATMPPDKGEQAPRRIPALIEWLSKKILDPASPLWWIVLDGFRVHIHPSATHDLIRGIIDAVDRDWRQTRLLLLNYENHLDIDLAPVILMEEIKPIQPADIELFFQDVYTQSGRAVIPDLIKNTAETVLSQVQEQSAKKPEKSYFTHLSTGLTLAAKELLRKQP